MTTLSHFGKMNLRIINAEQGSYNAVMIIDDNEQDRLVFSQLVAKTGFAKKILEADSGNSAIDWLAQFGNKPDDTLPAFIFLDLMMPEMDGFQFLDAFAKFSTAIKSRCKVIIFSSSSDIASRKKAMKHKTVYDYFIKPLQAEYFIKIREAFKMVD